MINNSDIVFIRHAESQLNIASHQFRVKHNLPYIWQLLCQYKEFLSDVKYNPDFIDCSITEKGIKQCIEARQHVKNINLDVILVSPLERTLQTCSLIFQNRNIPVIVEPLLSQAFRSSCDLSSQTSGKMKRYPNYNFQNVLKEGDHWFIKNDSQQNQRNYYSILEKCEGQTYDEKNMAILKYMTQTMSFEHPQNVRQRSWRIKELLKKYREKYNKIGVVAHYNTINYTVASSFNQMHEPADSANMKNCEVYWANLQQIMKSK